MTAYERTKVIAAGLAATTLLLGFYIGVLTIVSGYEFATAQFVEFWPYVVTLAIGFGAQVGLYLHLRQLSAAHQAHCGGAVAVSGTTSTVAMLACCTHYLANILPLLGVAGLVTFAAQYQLQFFWVGLGFNAAGFAYIAWQVQAASRSLKESHA